MGGFNLPPGCSVADIERAAGVDGYCEVCLCAPDNDCVCEECPECGAFGDPRCYEAHGMVLNPEIAAGRRGRETLMFIEDLQLEQYYETLGQEMDEEWAGERPS